MWKTNVTSERQEDRGQAQGKFNREPRSPLMLCQVRNHEEKAGRGTSHDENVTGRAQ